MAEVMDEKEINRVLTRISHEILERNKGCKNLVLIGIRTRGVYLAERIRAKIKQIEGEDIPAGIIDITLYRDDLHKEIPQHVVRKTEIPFSLKDKRVILIDDVLYTGRSIRAALDALIDIGRPSCIQLAVLIDRGHRELPIRADYVGKNLPTSRRESVRVMLKDMDGEERVIVEEQTQEGE